MRILRILVLGVFAVVLLSVLLVFDGPSANNNHQGPNTPSWRGR